MKPITIHPVSALAGAAVISMASLMASAQFQQPVVKAVVEQTINGLPTPQQMMRVVEGAPLVVPGGKLFVVTGFGALGQNGSTNSIDIEFDGTPVLRGHNIVALIGTGSVTGAGPSVLPVPAGLVATAGTSIEAVSNTSGTGVLLGYLADA